MVARKILLTQHLYPRARRAFNENGLHMKFPAIKNYRVPLAGVTVIIMLAVATWFALRQTGPGDEFTKGNGRIEATEIDIATKLGGRVIDVFAKEGDFVKAGQVLAQMQIDVLEAQREEARAKYRQAQNATLSAESQVAVRESDMAAAKAVVRQRESELDAAKRRLKRSQVLSAEGALSIQELDDNRATVRSAQAALSAAKAQVTAAYAAVLAAKAEVTGARSTTEAAEATIARIEADIADSQLKAPRDGRVQYRVAQPGEVLGNGGKVLNLVDVSDVYMTFFVPTKVAGKIALGDEARIILDAAPNYVIPAKISFVASTAQFTPKTVETSSEREKLMFRVKAQIPSELLLKNIQFVKTGLPGVAWLKLDAKTEWPSELALGKARE